MSIQDTIKVGDHVSALSERDNKAIGFSESPRQGRASSADQATPDSQTFQIKGTAPQGEEDTLPTCLILVQKWNDDGGFWARPTEGQDDDVDCWAKSTSDSRIAVQIQVVRAIVDPEFWKELSQSHIVRRKQGIDRLAYCLKESIEKKKQRTPAPRRGQLHIALDATRLPGLAFDVIVGYFQKHYGAWAGALGFSSIWLVGPNTRLTWRLDSKGEC